MTAPTRIIYGAYDATESRELEQLRRENSALRERLAFWERANLPSLTPRQMDLLRFLRGYIAAMEFAPSFDEIADAMGYGSLATVYEQLGCLEKKGYIRRQFNTPRSITLAPAARKEAA